jgi:hypothetical protein
LEFPTQEPCGCYDIGQIWTRTLETDAAIESLKASLEFSKTHGPLKFYDERQVIRESFNWGDANQRLGAALDSFIAKQVNEHGANAYFEVPGVQANTTYHAKEEECSTVVPDELKRQATPCQLAWIDVHEGVHREGCKMDAKSWNSILSKRIQEDINAYSAERDWLQLQRKRLLCACPYYNIRWKWKRTWARLWKP